MVEPPDDKREPDDTELFQLTLDLAPASIVVVDGDGRIVLVNRQSEALFGYHRDELLGKPVEMLVPGHFRGGHAAHRTAFLASPESRPMGQGRDLYALRKDGVEVPVEIGLNPITTRKGLMVVTSVFDLTERKRAEARFQAAVESSPSGVLMVDGDGVIVLANHEACRTFGYEVVELIGDAIEKLVPSRFGSAHPQYRDRYLTSPESRRMGTGRELFGLRKDGSEVPLEVGLTPINTDEGTFVLASVVDISTRRRMEDQLREAQRLETVGALASGIAHDFNNVLLAILGYSELALEDSRLEGATRSDLRQIITAAERGRQVVERMLEVGRRQQSPPQALRVHEPILEALELLQASTLKSVEIRRHLDETAPAVFCDSTQIHQIVMNLGSNAGRAMEPSGGVLDVSLVPHHVDASTSSGPALQPGMYARLTVSDNGHGMAPEVAARIYEPFYSSRPGGEGTGLGMWLVKELVDGMRGVIELVSEPGRGTRFDIYFPAAQQPMEAGVVDDVDMRSGAPHVMFVEDEAPLAELGRRRLERAGFRVSAYTSSVQALERFRMKPEAVDLLVTDNTMPRMSGLELAEQVVRVRPELPVLMVSGLAKMRVEDVPGFVTRVLAKPHSGEELVQAVSDLLPSSDPPHE